MSTQKRKAAKRRHAATTDYGKSKTPWAFFKSVCLSLSVTAIAGLLLLFISTALLMLTADPGRYASYAGYILLPTAVFIGGSIGTRFYAGAPLLMGLGTGALALILLLLADLCIPGKSSAALPVLLCLYAAIPLAGIAGALSLGKKKVRRRHR